LALQFAKALVVGQFFAADPLSANQMQQGQQSKAHRQFARGHCFPPDFDLRQLLPWTTNYTLIYVNGPPAARIRLGRMTGTGETGFDAGSSQIFRN